MAKSRIGHVVEAQILQAIGADYIDESEVLSPADPALHINKHEYSVPCTLVPVCCGYSLTVPVVCGAKNLGEALRRISEGAAMIRTKGTSPSRPSSSS